MSNLILRKKGSDVIRMIRPAMCIRKVAGAISMDRPQIVLRADPDPIIRMDGVYYFILLSFSATGGQEQITVNFNTNVQATGYFQYNSGAGWQDSSQQVGTSFDITETGIPADTYSVRAVAIADGKTIYSSTANVTVTAAITLTISDFKPVGGIGEIRVEFTTNLSANCYFVYEGPIDGEGPHETTTSYFRIEGGLIDGSYSVRAVAETASQTATTPRQTVRVYDPF